MKCVPSNKGALYKGSKNSIIEPIMNNFSNYTKGGVIHAEIQ